MTNQKSSTPLVELMAHHGYLPTEDVWAWPYDALRRFADTNADRDMTVTTTSGQELYGRFVTEGPLHVPGFVAMDTGDGVILIACQQRFTSWEDTDGINPVVSSIEFFGYEKGSPA